MSSPSPFVVRATTGMVSVDELTHSNSYKCIRTPVHSTTSNGIIQFGDPQITDDEDRGGSISPTPKYSMSADNFPNSDETEDKIRLLGVPKIVENYVILNREVCVVNMGTMPDLWF